jgi:hypothetical protein
MNSENMVVTTLSSFRQSRVPVRIDENKNFWGVEKKEMAPTALMGQEELSKSGFKERDKTATPTKIGLESRQ